MNGLTRRQFLETSAAALFPPPRSEPRRVVVPEFARTFEKALVCLPGPAEAEPFFEVAFRDLLPAVPSYSTLHVVARREPKDLAKGANVRFHLVEDPSVELDPWAQDMGEPVFLEGGERFLVAKRMNAATGAPGKMSSDRKRIAELVFGEGAVREAPFVFEGGNLAFDTDRILLGYNVASRTAAAYDAFSPGVTRARILDAIRVEFGGMEVIEMGTEPQRPLLQHIDQAFVILDGGVAVACRVRDGGLEAESRQLRRYASQLRELGYEVSFLDHGASDLERCRSSVNVVPFVDRSTGKKRVLVPIFPGELKEEAKVVDRAALIGKAARAFDLYRDLGYEPTPLRDVTHALGGNTHCIVNVLS